MLTQYQSQYAAWLLSRRIGGDSSDMLATTLVDAQSPNGAGKTTFAREFLPQEAGFPPVHGSLTISINADLKGSFIAMRRAAQRARQVALQTGTDLIVASAASLGDTC